MPGKPSDVTPVDWDKDHFDLEWKAPQNDGGAPIEKYIIEKKDKFGDWMPCAEVPGNECKGTAPNLIAGETYQFRVRAVNKAGPGEASDETKPMVAKPRRLAPKLNLAGLVDIRVKAGTPIHLEVPFEGEPQPTVTWKANNATIKSEDRREISTKENFTELHILRSERSDSGPYTIMLENEYGRDQGTCTVTVLDVPGVPEGPLKISDIHKEGCTLDWKPPLDNGGSEVLHYVVEKMDTSRGTWQAVDEFTDCHAKVTKLQPGKEYKFRIKAVNLQGESKPLTSDRDIVAKNPFDEPDAPEKPQVTDWDRDRIDIQWKPPKNDGGSPIKRYIIEKKEKTSPNWIECGQVPGASTTFSAKGLKEGDEYQFRVIAVNDAGPSNPSEPSDPQKAKPRNLAPKILTPAREVKVRAGMPLHFDVDYVGEPTPEITWTQQGQPTLPQHVSVDNKENKTALYIPVAKREDSGVYHLKLTNVNGKDEADFNIIVQDRPGTPQGPLEVSDVTKDSCVLAWKPPKDDGGAEITNYVVEKRDTRSGAWMPVILIVVIYSFIHSQKTSFLSSLTPSFGLTDPPKSELP